MNREKKDLFMHLKYSYLNDDDAVKEIRDHKWLESEKSGQEVGFATAAYDWINKYGEEWLSSRFESNKKFLSERRKYRRFSTHFPIEITVQNKSLQCKTNDISLIGFSCTLPNPVSQDVPVEVFIKLKDTATPTKKTAFKFQSRVIRLTSKRKHIFKKEYHAFLPFNEKVRNFLRANSKILDDEKKRQPLPK